MPVKRVPYFRQDETVSLIVDLAQRDVLTLVIGAGWSSDWGLPRWHDLLIRLLAEKVAPAFGIYDNKERETFAHEIVDAHGLIGAASIVRESLEDFYGALGSALYRSRRGTFGASAAAVARLAAVSPGLKLRILTTNYDRSLEAAIDRQGEDGSRPLEARSVATLNELATLVREKPKHKEPLDAPELVQKALAMDVGHIVPVYHLHGALDRLGVRAGRVVFSEEDYFAANGEIDQGWGQELLRQSLAEPNSVCMFLGMHLSDPNVLRQLFSASGVERPSGDTRRLAVLPRQGDHHWQAQDEPAEHIERAVRRRLARLNIDKIAPEFFTQATQLISEIAACREGLHEPQSPRSRKDGQLYRDRDNYANRLHTWRVMMETRKRLSLDVDKAFEAAQRENRDVLSRFRSLLYLVLRDVRVDRYANERLGVVLWARNPHADHRTLELWGSSERAWLERATILAPVIEDRSEYAAVRAFCSGPSALDPTHKTGSRWALSTQAVIRLQGPYKNLPVGVLILESNFDKSKSCLGFLPEAVGAEVLRAMEAIGEALLTPGVNPKQIKDVLNVEGLALPQLVVDLHVLVLEAHSADGPDFNRPPRR